MFSFLVLTKHKATCLLCSSTARCLLSSLTAHYTICLPAAVNCAALMCVHAPGMAAEVLQVEESNSTAASPTRQDLEHLPALAGLVQDATVPSICWVTPSLHPGGKVGTAGLALLSAFPSLSA